MISPEQLRRYPFFGLLADDELREIAMISDEVAFERGKTILREGDPAEALSFLPDGAISLNFTGAAVSGELPDVIPVGSIHPGEPFSISARIEPHILTADVQADRESRADPHRRLCAARTDRKRSPSRIFTAAKSRRRGH